MLMVSPSAISRGSLSFNWARISGRSFHMEPLQSIVTRWFVGCGVGFAAPDALGTGTETSSNGLAR